MIARFVLGGCSNVKDKEKRISIHASLLYDDPWPETRKILIRRRWIQFVQSTVDKNYGCVPLLKNEFFVRNYSASGIKHRI